jgi:cobalt-zinc-cadmium efflux system outer membrane protein
MHYGRRTMPDLRQVAALSALFVLGAGPAAAQVAPPFPDLLRQALAASPRLAVGRARIEAAEGDLAQAAVRPNPRLGLEVENVGGGGPFHGLDRAETTLLLEQPLELGGKRGARIDTARSEVAAAEARAVQLRAEFAHDLAIAYATSEATAVRAGIAAEALALAEDDARKTRLLVENGREAEVRSLQAAAAVSAAAAELDLARADAQAALARLSALSLPPAPFVAVAGGLLDAPLSPELARQTEGPAIAVARAEREAAVLRIESERRRATPDLTVSLGARRFEAEDSGALIAGISAPLPLFDRNRGAVAAASANARAAEARLAQARAETEAERRIAAGQASAAASRLTATRQGEAAAAEAYRLVRLGYDAGRLPLVEVLNARRALIEARGRTLDARFARVRAAAELARAQGLTVAGDPL